MRTTLAIVVTAQYEKPILDEVQIDDPHRGEVLVDLRASGICHTDIAAVRDARHYPVLLGHEGAGVVAAVGPGVTHVSPGDHVVINWQPRCNACRRCQSGRSDLCEEVRGTSGPRVFWRGKPISLLLHSGTFCSQVVMPANGVVAIRKDISFPEAALLGCAVATGVGAALFTANIQPGDQVAILGVGGVGLNIAQGARLANASEILAVDLEEQRLALAKSLGATQCLNSGQPDWIEAARDITRGRGFDFVFDVTGSPSLMQAGIALLARGGELILVGAAARDQQLSLMPRRFMSDQLALRSCIYGNIRPAIHLPMLADWSCQGRVNVKCLISQSVSLHDVPGLFAEPERLRGIRTVVEWDAPERQAHGSSTGIPLSC